MKINTPRLLDDLWQARIYGPSGISKHLRIDSDIESTLHEYCHAVTLGMRGTITRARIEGRLRGTGSFAARNEIRAIAAELLILRWAQLFTEEPFNRSPWTLNTGAFVPESVESQERGEAGWLQAIERASELCAMARRVRARLEGPRTGPCAVADAEKVLRSVRARAAAFRRQRALAEVGRNTLRATGT